MNNGIREKLEKALQRWADQAGVHVPDHGAMGSPESFVAAARDAGVDEGQVLRVVAEAIGLRYFEDLSGEKASTVFVEKVPIGFARRHGLLGLSGKNGRLPVVMGGVEAWGQLEVVGRYLDQSVEVVLAPPAAVTAAINAAYQQQNGQAQALIADLDRREVLAEIKQLHGREDLLDVAGRAPVVKLVNLILFEAVKLLASDVHVQPYENKLMVRMRIDGVLTDVFDLPRDLADEVVSRIKVMGRMNIAEKRLPQDGRATAQVGDRLIDLRVSSIPTSHGERVVIRLLDKTAQLYSLGELGMDEQTLAGFRRLIMDEHGLVLVTGPTGSGKSTTLYAALQQINSRELNVLTLEDPIEYQLPGISQTQVSAKKGMTFASGLRSVLRQDPDVIMVGEIRDHETAVMAIQSALTGHLVFSTLHTNDAASAVTRLLDLGIEPYLVASSVVGVMAQRLVRQVCRECAEPFKPEPDELMKVGLDPERVDTSSMRVGAGCGSCRKTGYRGRIGVFELLVVDEAIREQVQSRATASRVKATGVGEGMRTLADDGIDKMLRGLTTIEEVVRVTTRSTG